MLGEQQASSFVELQRDWVAFLKQQQGAIPLGVLSRDDSLRTFSQLQGILSSQAALATPSEKSRQDRERKMAKAAKISAKHDKEMAGLDKLEAEGTADDAEDEDEDEEELYHEYRPAKVSEGSLHPDPIVETAVLGGIQPPDPSYKHHLKDIVKAKKLSSAQIETVIYAMARFNGPRLANGQRAGFFLGDGAGVGKGRQIAALIKEFMACGGQKTVWVSVSNDLRYDARRDLEDVEAAVEVFPKEKDALPKGSLDKAFGPCGVLFVTYSLISHGAYGSATSRLTQIVKWLEGKDGNGECLIIFDECHKAKNLVKIGKKGEASSTATGKAVELLQDLLPNARVLYSSATGASEPRNLCYMTRLGTCGFETMHDLVKALEGSGLNSLELFSVGLKATGTYLARTLSYSGAEFSLAQVEVDPVFRVMYDRAVDLWQLVYAILSALDNNEKMSPLPRKIGGLFWSAHQRFFRQMLLAAKVPECARLATEAVNAGMAAVIGLQSTGEANTMALRETEGDEMDDFISAPKLILGQFLQKHFPTKFQNCSAKECDILAYQVNAAMHAFATLAPAEVEGPRMVKRLQREAKARMLAEAALCPEDTGPSYQGPSDVKVKDEDVLAEDKDAVLAERMEAAKRTGMFVDLKGLGINETALKEEVAEIDKELDEADRKTSQGSNKHARRLQMYLEDRENAEQELSAARSALAQLMDPNTKVQTPIKQSGGIALSRCKREKATSKESVDDWSDSEDDEEYVSEEDDLDKDDDFEIGEEINDLPCAICKSTDAEEEMLLCDKCDEGYHMFCLRPPLKEIPDGDWFCPACSGIKPQGSDVAPETAKRSETKKTFRDDDVIYVCSDSEDEMKPSQPARDPPGKRKLVVVDSDDDEAPTVSVLPERKRLKKRSLEVVLSDDFDVIAEDEDEDKKSVLKDNVSNPSIHIKPEAPSHQLPAPAHRPPSKLAILAARKRVEAAEAALREAVKALDSVQTAVVTPGVLNERKRSGTPPNWLDNYDDADEYVAKNGTMGYKHCVKHVSLGNDWEDEEEDDSSGSLSEPDENPGLVRIKRMLLRLLDAQELPANPLDQLIDLLGPDKVAELTGRKGGLIRGRGGKVEYTKRGSDVAQKMVNIMEKEAFMSGLKNIAIISEAASTGISLQADKRCGNQRRRVHLTLELPWSADKAIQQFGRSHRSNQTSAPIYRIIVTRLGGEVRFASSAAKRLQSLGALLRGDRRALGAGADLKEFDVDNIWGKRALQRLYSDISGFTEPMPNVKIPDLPPGLVIPLPEGGSCIRARRRTPKQEEFFQIAHAQLQAVGIFSKTGQVEPRLNKDVPRFLNRLLGMHLPIQELIFTYFTRMIEAIIAIAKSQGDFDFGIQAIEAEQVEILTNKVIHIDNASGAATRYISLNTDRGLAWENAIQRREDFFAAEKALGRIPLAENGFYRERRNPPNGARYCKPILATEVRSGRAKDQIRFRVSAPNNKKGYIKTRQDLMAAYVKVGDDMAEQCWTYWHRHYETGCTHHVNCYNRRHGGSCTIGTRMSEVHFITGAVLPVWRLLSVTVIPSKKKSDDNSWFGTDDGEGENSKKKTYRPRVTRAALPDGKTIVGLSLSASDARRFVKTCHEHYPEFDVDEAIVVE